MDRAQRGPSVLTESQIFSRAPRPIGILSYDHYFFHFHFFDGTRPRAAALLRFVYIIKEPMISCNSCIATSSYL